MTEPVKADVLGFGSLEKFFDLDEAYLPHYIVDSNGVEEWYHQGGKWKQTKFNLD